MTTAEKAEKAKKAKPAVSIAIVLAVFAIALPGAAGDIGGAMEEGFMLVLPERILAGAIPNRDFLFLYGPGSLWVLAAAFAVAEPALAVERAIGAAQLIAVALGVWALARPQGPWMQAACGVVAAVFALAPIGLVALPWMGGLAFVVWGAVLAERRPAVAGTLMGIALLYRPDLAVAVALVVLAHLPQAAAAARRRQLLIGIAAGAAPMLIHVAMAGAPAAFDGMLVDPVFRLRPGRHLPVPPSAGTLDGYLQRIAELDVIDFPAPLEVPMQLRLWFVAVVVATAVIAVAGWRARRTNLHLATIAAIAVGILPQAVQRPDSTHLAWVSCVTIALLPVVVTGTRIRIRVAATAATAATAALVVLVFPAFTLRPYTELVLQTFGQRRTAVEVDHGGRRFLVGRADVARAVEHLAPMVDRATRPGDRLFVGPSDLSRTPYADSWLYHLFPDLVPATRFVEMDPGIADDEHSGLARDLASADAVLLTSTWDGWVEPNASTEPGSAEPALVLASRFCLADRMDGVSLYLPCAG